MMGKRSRDGRSRLALWAEHSASMCHANAKHQSPSRVRCPPLFAVVDSWMVPLGVEQDHKGMASLLSS